MNLPWPPLPTTPAPDVAPDSSSDLPGAQEPHAVSPAFPPGLLHDIARREEAFAWAPSGSSWAAGQLRALSGALVDAPLVISLLLVRELSAGSTDTVWEGFLITPDVDYAGNRDWVIQAEDGASDPACGVVLTDSLWRFPVRADARWLGELHPATVADIMALADQPDREAGRLGVQEFVPGRWAVTGQRGPHDLARKAYLDALHAAVEPLRYRAGPTTGAIGRVVAGGSRPWRQPAWWAASVFAVLWLGTLLPLTGLHPVAEGSRSLGADWPTMSRPMVRVPGLIVMVSPDASVGALRAALTHIDGSIASGPGDDGEYVIALRSLSPAIAIERLRATGLIDRVAELPGGVWVAP